MAEPFNYRFSVSTAKLLGVQVYGYFTGKLISKCSLKCQILWTSLLPSNPQLHVHLLQMKKIYQTKIKAFVVFPPAYKKGMVKFPRKGHFQRAATYNGGTFKRAWTY